MTNTATALHEYAGLLAGVLRTLPDNGHVVALSVDNSHAWLAADKACQIAHKICVPLPHFFTPAQKNWALDSTGAGILLTDQADDSFWQAAGFISVKNKLSGLVCLLRSCPTIALPRGTAKITFTSGSTGQPKGVCLSQQAMDAVATSIAGHMKRCDVQRHLCALPLPVLLENVAGAQAAMRAGAECVVPSLTDIGWQGSSRWNAAAFLDCMVGHQAESMILLPQMLKDILPLLPSRNLSSLKLVAVGGARMAPGLLQEARASGLPVYEGYGLSECASVVCFNHPGADKPGTVGKPLPHTRVRINTKGELEVFSENPQVYIDRSPVSGSDSENGWITTGDLASIDEDGFITIHGRSKNLIISSFGRNISPEWVESELLAQTGIVQAAVFGEAKPWLTAVIFAPTLSDKQLAEAVTTANTLLPDYAQLKDYLRATEPFTHANGQSTTNGRNRRDSIAARYSDAIDTLYQLRGENIT